MLYFPGNPECKKSSRLPQQDDPPLPVRPAPVQVRISERVEARSSRGLQALPASLQPSDGGIVFKCVLVRLG